jgi:hypothetical protein
MSLTHVTLTIGRNENESQCLISRVVVEVPFRVIVLKSLVRDTSQQLTSDG